MKYLTLLITIIFSSYYSYAQDPSVFNWNPKKMDSVTRIFHKTKYTEKIVDTKVGVYHLKYIFEPEGHLFGVIYTYENSKLIYLTTVFNSSQSFVDTIQRRIEANKSINVLFKSEYEMVIYNSEKKIYTVLYIDEVQKLLFMCHSLKNPMDKRVVKKI